MNGIHIASGTALLQVNLTHYDRTTDTVAIEVPSVGLQSKVLVERNMTTDMSSGPVVRIISDGLGDTLLVKTNLGLFATDVAQLHNHGYILTRVEDTDGNSIHMKDVR